MTKSTSRFWVLPILLFLFLISFTPHVIAQTPHAELKIAIIADYATWEKYGDLGSQAIIDKLTAGTFEAVFFESPDYTFTITAPYKTVIMEEQNDWHVNDYCPWSAEVEGWFNNYANSPQCVDLIVYLTNETNTSNGHCVPRVIGAGNGTPVVFVRWDPFDSADSRLIDNIIAHEMGHAFNAVHINDIPPNTECKDYCSLDLGLYDYLDNEGKYKEIEGILCNTIRFENSVNSWYTNHGDVFAISCLSVTVVLFLAALTRRIFA